MACPYMYMCLHTCGSLQPWPPSLLLSSPLSYHLIVRCPPPRCMRFFAIPPIIVHSFILSPRFSRASLSLDMDVTTCDERRVPLSPLPCLLPRMDFLLSYVTSSASSSSCACVWYDLSFPTSVPISLPVNLCMLLPLSSSCSTVHPSSSALLPSSC